VQGAQKAVAQHAAAPSNQTASPKAAVKTAASKPAVKTATPTQQKLSPGMQQIAQAVDSISYNIKNGDSPELIGDDIRSLLALYNQEMKRNQGVQ